jgi:hypothetical protein
MAANIISRRFVCFMAAIGSMVLNSSTNVKGLAPATGSAPPLQVEVYRHPPSPTRIG